MNGLNSSFPAVGPDTSIIPRSCPHNKLRHSHPGSSPQEDWTRETPPRRNGPIYPEGNARMQIQDSADQIPNKSRWKLLSKSGQVAVLDCGQSSSQFRDTEKASSRCLPCHSENVMQRASPKARLSAPDASVCTPAYVFCSDEGWQKGWAEQDPRTVSRV